MKNNYIWKYGYNESQTFYETEIEKDYLCIYAIKKVVIPKCIWLCI